MYSRRCFVEISSSVAFIFIAIGFGLKNDLWSQENAVLVKSQVHGYVVAKVSAASGPERTILLPGVTVFLKDAKSGKPGTKTKSDSIGRFVIPDCEYSTYHVCWEAVGFEPGQSRESVVVNNRIAFAPLITITPQLGYVFGRVTLSDGSVPGYVDTTWDIDVQAKVSLLDGDGATVSSVEVNHLGEYLIPKVSSQRHSIRAECEAVSVSKELKIIPAIVDLKLPSSPPVVNDVFATINDRRVRRVPPGTTVDCLAQVSDPDRDDVRLQWLASDEINFLGIKAGESVKWTLPKGRGLHVMYVLARDGKGGYAFGKMNISTDGKLLPFDTERVLPKDHVSVRKVKAPSSSFAEIPTLLPKAAAACMRLSVDSQRLKLPFNLRITIPVANSDPEVRTQLITEPLSVIPLLPPNTNITLNVLDFANRVVVDGNQLDSNGVPTNIFNSGGVVSGSNPPSYPYAECGSEAKLTLNVKIPPGGAHFLNFLNSPFKPPGTTTTPEIADAYYAAIDPDATFGPGTISSAGINVTGTVAGGSQPSFLTFFTPGDIIRAAGQVRTVKSTESNSSVKTSTAFNPPIPAGTQYERVGKKTTLQRWKKANGFDQGNFAEAAFFNEGDLGFGRRMRAQKQGSGANVDIAYYVTNYPTVDDARQDTDAIATVAMEYSRVGNNDPRFTKFYVFAHNRTDDQDASRVNTADLDNRGQKAIPTLCITCHGGAKPNPEAINGIYPNSGNVGATFLPFDLESYSYSIDSDSTRNAQEAEFKKLNELILLTEPPSATTELIQGWYKSGRPTQDSGFVPIGWTSPLDKSLLYNNVVKTSCRTCHVAQAPQISWDRYDDPQNNLAFKRNAKLKLFTDNLRLMPQSLKTYQNYWFTNVPFSRPALLLADLNAKVLIDPDPASASLKTTEAGGAASFSVVLSTPPTADVTIAVETSDGTEGTVSPAKLTFTSSNFNTPQTVTITGIDDTDKDGDILYNVVFASIISTDPNYSGVDVQDFSVTNIDND